MKIKELFIDAFGSYNNFQLDLTPTNSPVTIVYGPNEAGKSTLHAFLRAMLFGFQLKGMSSYQLGQAGKLSGRMTIEDETGQVYYLERSRPPQQGKLTLLAENGDELPATTLTKLLGNVSAPLFTNIFAFGHQELQRLETLQGEEIASYLFSAALGNGASQLVEIEKELAKQRDALFRPRAANPIINQLIKELEEEQLAVEQLQSKLTSYTTIKQRLTELEEELAQLHRQRKACSAKRGLYEKKAKLIEIAQELVQLETERRKLDQFPSVLLAQRESLHALCYEEQRMKDLEKQIKHLDEQVNNSQEKLKDTVSQQERKLQRERASLNNRWKNRRLLSIIGLAAACLLPILLFLWTEHTLASVFLFASLLWLTKEQYQRWQEYESKEKQLQEQLAQLRAEYEQEISRVAQWEEERSRYKQEVQRWQTHLFELAANVSLPPGTNPYSVIAKLKDYLAKEEQVEAQLLATQSKQQQLLDEQQALEQAIDIELLTLEERQFFEQLNQDNITAQLANLQVEYTSILQAIERVAKESGKLETELAALANEEELTRKQQALEEKKAELKHQAEKWATYSLANYMCQQIRQLYEVERQPHILQQASRFFEQMTLGRYRQIMIPFAEKSLQVIRQDQQRLTVDQLSRGTVEQLYLAMRYAVVQDYEKIVSLPLIMDDILINFDRQRAKEALYGLRELANRHQLIYFTCHEHMLTLIREVLGQVNIVQLSGEKTWAEIKG